MHTTIFKRNMQISVKKISNNAKISNSKRFNFLIAELMEITQRVSLRRELIVIRVWLTSLGSLNPRPVIFTSEGSFITKDIIKFKFQNTGKGIWLEQGSIFRSLRTVATLENSINNIGKTDSWKMGNFRVILPISSITAQSITQNSFDSTFHQLFKNLNIKAEMNNNSTFAVDVFLKNGQTMTKISELPFAYFLAEIDRNITKLGSLEKMIQKIDEAGLIVNSEDGEDPIELNEKWSLHTNKISDRSIRMIETARINNTQLTNKVAISSSELRFEKTVLWNQYLEWEQNISKLLGDS